MLMDAGFRDKVRASTPIPLRLRSHSIEDSKTRTVIPVSSMRSFSKEKGRDAIGVTVHLRFR